MAQSIRTSSGAGTRTWRTLWLSQIACLVRASAVEVEAISGALMLVRQQAIADVGMLDAGYFLHCEDLDWFVRFREHGWP